jgi:hypothetical protein
MAATEMIHRIAVAGPSDAFIHLEQYPDKLTLECKSRQRDVEFTSKDCDYSGKYAYHRERYFPW